VNVPTNLKLVQNVLPQVPYENSSIFDFQKWKLDNKSLYMSRYVHFNIIMKVLWEIYKILLYIATNATIKSK
jgi:hypothetical protein